MVKDSKKSSSAAKQVVAGVPTPPVRSSAAEKGKKKLKRSPEKKKIKKKDMKDDDALLEIKDDVAPLEMKDDNLPLHLYETYVQEMILPEDSKTLYATNLHHPVGRRLAEADFEEFFGQVGKVVKVEIQLDPKRFRIVEFAKIEFESHDVAIEAMKMHGSWFFNGPIQLNGVPKLKARMYNNTDCTNERKIVSCFGFGKAISCNKLKSELKEKFSSVGEVVSVTVAVDEIGLSLGCAYVHFTNEESLNRAIALNGSLFLDSPLQVRRAKVFVTSS